MSISCRFSLTQFQKALNGFIDSQRKDKARHVSPSRIVAPKIVAIQEYHTSQLCRECHCTKLKQTRARECIIFGGNKRLWGVKCTYFGTVGADRTKSLISRYISACDLCWVRWNRDISAAFNMLYLYVYQSLNGGRRPEGFFVSA
jgi:hypothetical protein